MEEQKQMYKAKLAQLGHSPTVHNEPRAPGHPTVLPPSSGLPAATREGTTPSTLHTSTLNAHDTQPALWKSEYDRPTDQNSEPREARTGELAIKDLIAEDVKKTTQHLDLQIQHHKPGAEMLDDTNSELRRQLQERASSSEKQKADDELELQHDGNGGGESPKKARSG